LKFSVDVFPSPSSLGSLFRYSSAQRVDVLTSDATGYFEPLNFNGILGASPATPSGASFAAGYEYITHGGQV